MDSLSYVTVTAPVPPDCLPVRLLRQFGDPVHGRGEPFERHSEHRLVVCIGVRSRDNEALAHLHRVRRSRRASAECHRSAVPPLLSISQGFGRSLSCDMSFGYVGQDAEPRLSINRRAILPSEIVVSG